MSYMSVTCDQMSSAVATADTAEYGRVFNDARRAQGFTSQANLDAWFAYYDHTQACGECGQPAPAHWSEADASWQPAVTVCAEARRLSDAETAIRTAETAARRYVVTFNPEPVTGPGALDGLRRHTLADARKLAADAVLGSMHGRIVDTETLEVVARY